MHLTTLHVNLCVATKTHFNNAGNHCVQHYLASWWMIVSIYVGLFMTVYEWIFWMWCFVTAPWSPQLSPPLHTTDSPISVCNVHQISAIVCVLFVNRCMCVVKWTGAPVCAVCTRQAHRCVCCGLISTLSSGMVTMSVAGRLTSGSLVKSSGTKCGASSLYLMWSLWYTITQLRSQNYSTTQLHLWEKEIDTFINSAESCMQKYIYTGVNVHLLLKKDLLKEAVLLLGCITFCLLNAKIAKKKKFKRSHQSNTANSDI